MRMEFEREFTADINFNRKNSWGGEQVASTELSNSDGIMFTVPSISSFQEGRSYLFTTAIYSPVDGGAFKVAHTILDLISDPKDWWLKQYGRALDPALNLPFLFTHHDPNSQHANIDWWTVKTKADDTEDTRYEMRGFLMRNNYKDPVSGARSFGESHRPRCIGSPSTVHMLSVREFIDSNRSPRPFAGPLVLKCQHARGGLSRSSRAAAADTRQRFDRDFPFRFELGARDYPAAVRSRAAGPA